MKKILTLLLLLIYNPVFAQLPEPVESDLTAIEQRLQSIRDFYQPAEVDSLQANWDGNRIKVAWEPFQTDRPIDIQYYSPDLHKEWVHSVQTYLEKGYHNRPVVAASGHYPIGGLLDAANEYTWYVRMQVGDWTSERVLLPADPKVEPVPAPEPKFVWHGLWDMWLLSDEEKAEFNTLMTYDVKECIEASKAGKTVVLKFSGRLDNLNTEKFTKEEASEWRKTLRGWADKFRQMNPDRTLFLLWDEPMGKAPHKQFTKKELEEMIKIFKEEIGDEYKAGFSFVRERVRLVDMPYNLDFILPPMYLFYTEDADPRHPQIWTKHEFDAYFDHYISDVREKLPGVEVYITPQGFHGQRWRKPPIEAAQWYLEAVWRNDVKGMFWWEIGESESDWFKLSTMPEYFEAVKKLNELIPDRQ